MFCYMSYVKRRVFDQLSKKWVRSEFDDGAFYTDLILETIHIKVLKI